MFTKILIDSQYSAFIVFVITTISVCIIMLTCGWLLGGRSSAQHSKNTPFESGIQSTGDTHIRFAAKFYLIAIFFVIFDVETSYLYAWAISIRNNGWNGFIEATIFIAVLLLSLFYLVRIGAMNWTPSRKNIMVNSNLVDDFYYRNNPY
ncbi:NADH-quinone oxidoreductase subunit A [Pantoea sp. Mhis]|uniref:NADH-quinone oxidoreductase subunit A n=1 Tax=Pantoea sp. Mhis TaxID=2576759 RepID=UPI00135AD75A|nr:NADH-quinone oxidoreductase subunit A [Pantoea sp. Mhis]MXP56091.1 NADH-quinone oxidoreductase subunit A [Pantoea sp. Mhis]